MQKNPVKAKAWQDENCLELLIMVWIYRIAMVLMMVAGIFWLDALPVQQMPTECTVVLAVYTTMMVLLQGVYRACDVGMVRVSELVMSQVLTNVLNSGMIYVGVALYTHRIYNPVMLAAVVCAQTVFGMIWSVAANHMYFMWRRPPKAAVIYRDEALLEKLCQTPHFRSKYRVVKLLCNPVDDIEVLVRAIDGCEVVFALGVSATMIDKIAKLCLEKNIKGYFMPHLGHIIMAGAEYMATFSLPMLRVRRAGWHSEYRVLKRAFDLCASLVGIVATAPIMAVTAFAIWREDRGPVFYRQIRLTKNGKEFSILKFRSMTVNAEQDGVARLAGENDSRITKVGRFIRACRIDELPQLFNILKGDMSIVGPRPERPEIARQYEEELPEFALRLQVKAGLTGLAQVYGRYNTEPYNKLQMDLMYINEMSFLKDLQLILATVKVLFVKESTQGIAQGKETAMEEPARRDLHKPA